MDNRKSKVRSFRLDSGLLEELKTVAEREKTSENAFVEGILARRIKTDPIITAFPYVVLSRKSFSSILGMANPDGLEVVGQELGRRNFAFTRELYESVGQEVGFAQYLGDILDEQAHWFFVEGGNKRPEKLILRHEYGYKWSIFLKSFLIGAHEVVSRDRIRIDLADSYLRMELISVR